MEKTMERVLAFNLAVEMSQEEMNQISGGANTYTYGRTRYTTGRHGQADEENDEQWD